MDALFIVVGDVGDTYQLHGGRKSAIYLSSSSSRRHVYYGK